MATPPAPRPRSRYPVQSFFARTTAETPRPAVTGPHLAVTHASDTARSDGAVWHDPMPYQTKERRRSSKLDSSKLDRRNDFDSPEDRQTKWSPVTIRQQPHRSQQYPVQNFAQHVPPKDDWDRSASVATYVGSASPASPASPKSEASGALPRIPRNVRALKDGKSHQAGRTIVICLDGTGDKFDSDNSNIVHLVSCLKKSDPSQLTYYQSGIGTYDGGGVSNGLHAALDMAIGSGLGVHIRDAYHFLMQNYLEGDRICLFGFSRGAYTARCLAGMVHKVGLLPKHNVQQLPFAYQYYKDDSDLGWKMSAEFKRTFCIDVSIHFIGVFDSVASVGIIPRRLPLSSTPWNKATYFRHALALDEHRAKFKAKPFETKDSIHAKWETEGDWVDDTACEAQRNDWQTGNEKTDGQRVDTSEAGHKTDLYTKRRRLQQQAKETDVLEVWFSGAHADVGGGAEKNAVRHKLAQIPLRWMLRQCFECDTGIIFKVHRLAQEGLDVHTLWPTYTPLGMPRVGPGPELMEKHRRGDIPPITRRSVVLKAIDEEDLQGQHEVELWSDERRTKLHDEWVPEHVEDHFDSLARINDQLVGATAWWILELWPIKDRVERRDKEGWVKKVSLNLGRYRSVQDPSPNLHWTVRQRMDASDRKLRVRLGRKAGWNVVA